MKRTWIVAAVAFVLGASVTAVWLGASSGGAGGGAGSTGASTTTLSCGGSPAGDDGEREDEAAAGETRAGGEADDPERASEPSERVWIDAGPGRGVFRVTRADRERRTRLETALRTAAERRVAEAPDEEPTGHLEPAYIQQQIRELSPLLAECYELALAEDPELSGRLVVEFGIAGEEGVGGIVDESRIDAEASDLSHPVLNECVRETLYTAEFDAPEGGGRVTVRYPFVMTRDEAEREEDRGI